MLEVIFGLVQDGMKLSYRSHAVVLALSISPFGKGRKYWGEWGTQPFKSTKRYSVFWPITNNTALHTKICPGIIAIIVNSYHLYYRIVR